MEQSALKTWQDLHLRSVRGETLTQQEQTFYDAENARMDTEEEYPNSIERLRILRQGLKNWEVENTQLRHKIEANRRRIVGLESRLPQSERQLLGIGG